MGHMHNTDKGQAVKEFQEVESRVLHRKESTRDARHNRDCRLPASQYLYRMKRKRFVSVANSLDTLSPGMKPRKGTCSSVRRLVMDSTESMALL